MSWLKRKSSEDAVACVVFATLYFLRVWIVLLVPARQYHLILLPGSLDFAVVTANVLCIAALMYLLLMVSRRWPDQRASGIVVLLYLVVLFAFVGKSNGMTLGWATRTSILALLGSGLIVVWKWPSFLSKLFRSLAFILAPAALLIALKSAESLLLPFHSSPISFSQRVHAQSFSQQVHQSGSARTAWIIFDEMDYTAAFDERPPSLDLPEFDRLRKESLFALNAVSPAQWTEWAIPALTTGKHVTDVVPKSDDLLLRIEGAQYVSWTSGPTIFSQARGTGMTIGLVGWYHPYCRLFGKILSSCTSVGFPRELEDRVATLDSIEEGVVEVASGDLSDRLIEKVLSLDQTHKRRYIASYQLLVGAARQALIDPSLDFVVIHMPVPHPPFIYDRKVRGFSTQTGDYFDNLALADRTLGILRRSMEDAGMWDSTNILVIADHGYRALEDSGWKHKLTPLHVPFILKLQSSQRHVETNVAFNTILVHDLLLALLQKKIVNPAQAEAFLGGSSNTRFEN